MKPEMLVLVALAFTAGAARAQQQQALPVPVITTPSGSGAIEQHAPGKRAAPRIVASFDGLGVGFVGPQGQSYVRNPSDNSLAVGPNHIVQIVNSVVAIYTKKGKLFDTTGKVLYGPVPTNNVIKGFGGVCEARNSGDGVIRYDQLADRWLFVRAVGRGPERPDQPEPWLPGSAHLSPPGQAQQPGAAATLVQPAPFPPPSATDTAPRPRGQAPGRGAAQRPQGPSSMCYAISAGPDPLGAYYRYEFLRPYFPDYPRPAVWPDGYYVPTSTGDNRISETVTTQKHACVVERAKMLEGQPAGEQCVVIQDVGFLNNADVDGTALPPAGAPNIMIAARGTQLTKVFEAAALDVWQFHVDWKNPQNTRVSEPTQIAVAPYHYLCDGQLSNCVSQPGTDRRLDAQGDKIMARVASRRIGDRESIVAAQSVNTTTGGGAVRWYELRVGPNRTVSLYQQGTYLADAGLFRWMPSPAMDRYGNIGIGYSFGGGSNFAGQRFSGRLANDPKGQLTLQEAVLANGEASLTSTSRWEDYTQTAVDPSDDCTIWYVGDYLKRGETRYSSRIGAFRLPGCGDESSRRQSQKR